MSQNNKIKLKLLFSLFLVIATFSVYYQVKDFDSIILDDNGYVFKNSHVRNGLNAASIHWALTTTEMGNWHPMTWLSYMLDSQLYGTNPAGYHLSNLFFHIINSLLLFWILDRLTGALWKSCFVASAFALHPLHIESVAWIAERKDVLSCLFLLITIYSYAKYVEKREPHKYIMTLLAFSLGLMTKPMIVTLPLLLLLMDYWPLKRLHFPKDIMKEKHVSSLQLPLTYILVEKVPFFVLSAFFGVITIFAQHKGNAVASFAEFPFSYRLENALVAFINYIYKTAWPAQLSIIYPLSASIPTWQAVGASALLIFISFTVIHYYRNYPFLLVGWFWFLIVLLPVIGLLQVGVQKMADRFTYIPHIGLFILATWLMPELLSKFRYRRIILAIASTVIVLSLSISSWYQLGHWKNAEKIFTRAHDVAHDGNYLAHNILGSALLDQGRIDEAIPFFEEAVQINPKSPEMLCGLGRALTMQGKYDKALAQYANALRLEPNNAMANYNMGSVLSQTGNFQEAVDFFLVAIKIDSNYYEARNNLGIAYARLGKTDEAITQFTEALRIDPQSSKINYNLGVMLVAQGRYNDADKYFKETLRIDPSYIEAQRDFEINQLRILVK